MPRAVKNEKVQSGINVTPLVDVVLVLLIIFMIIAPQLQTETSVDLPITDRPQDKPDDGRRIEVTIEAGGFMWIDAEPVTFERFPDVIRQKAIGREDHQVVIKADARLTFGEVQETMFAVEGAGFRDVGLIAERIDEAG